MCDTAVLFKTAVKQLAVKHGYTATFMAKWHEDHSGSSGHIHQSLIDGKSGKPVFHDETRPYRMSEIAEGYVAGQLDLFRPLTLFFAPVTNSYKRFQPDSFAGFVATWGIDNRTVSLRVINSSPGKMRMENRIGGADINPYVAFAASSRSQVEAFYQAALRAGGRDTGGPGVRPHYHPNHYAAFVLDPDGNNVEAVCRRPG